jgi:RimJ/RimL family protein N-acetyltransferase
MLVRILPFSSNNFSFQNLELNQEQLENYLSWMRDIENNLFIESIDKSFSLEKLTQYIDEKNSSSQALLLGIFDNRSGIHFGNIKFEPIDMGSRSAWLGILIGDLQYRGKGYAKEIIDSTCKHISNKYNINKIFLGVNKNNSAALKTYLKSNFRIQKESSSEGLILIRED